MLPSFTPQQSRGLSRIGAAVCVLLLLLGATVQLTHTHVPQENHADCALCVTAHGAVEIVVPPTAYVAPVTPIGRPPKTTAHPPQPRVLPHPLQHRPPPAA